MKTTYGCRLVYHYHIPKTGGTTLFANLRSDSKKWVCINTGGERKQYIEEMETFVRGETGRIPGIYARSHNTMSYMKQVGKWGLFDTAFFAYRDPLLIQISNMNMIIRRVLGYADGVISKDSEIGAWTEKWIYHLGLTNDELCNDSETLALIAKERLLSSEEYIKQYSCILKRYFSDDEQLSQAGKQILVISMSDLNRLIDKIMPDRRVDDQNVACTYYLTISDIPDIIKTRLVDDDRRIAKQLLQISSDNSQYEMLLDAFRNQPGAKS